MPAASLTRRFLLTLLLSAAIPLVAFGWFALVGMRERMEQRIGDVYLPQLASDAANALVARIDQARKGLALLVAPAASALADPARLRDFDEQIRLQPGVNDDFDLILLLAEDGRVRHAHYNPRFDPTTRGAREALRPDAVDSEWFRALMTSDAEIWLDRHLSPFLHRTTERTSRDPAEYHVGLALRVSGAAAGALYALVRWERVQEVVDSTAAFLRDPERGGLPSAACFVSDPSGTALAHTDRGRYGESLVPPEARARVFGARRSPVAFVDGKGEPRRGGITRVDGLPSSLRWWLGVHALEAELFASSREFARLLTTAIGGLVAILAVWSLIASRAVLRPVRELAQATRRLAAGDLGARVVHAGPAELGQLSRDFNQMAVDLERSREQLRQAERQAAWAEMARQVAHEIKNPLTPMRMSAQLLQRARRDADSRVLELSDRLAKTVLDQTDNLARIAADFRQFAGPARRQRERVPVDALLADLAAFFADLAQVRGVDLRVGAAPPGVAIDGDRQELGRVLVNLVQNAIEVGGRCVEVAASLREGDVVLTVGDDGPGVPAEARGRLFEPYFTTKTSGTGLGLAICKRIVEAHGGDVGLQTSRPGATVFVVRLPAHRVEGP
ncbi:MAG: HAMP domain-containing sensor histidine kinase [Planctomycetota bacterium]